MNRIFITLFLALTALTANAQDILNELRRDQGGQGKIVVNQSRDIEQLVNAKSQTVNTDVTTSKVATTAKTQTSVQKTTTKSQTTTLTKSQTTATKSQTTAPKSQTVVTKSQTNQAAKPQTVATAKAQTTVATKPVAKPSTQTTTQKQTSQDKVAVKPVEKKETEHAVAVTHDIDTLVKDTTAQTPKMRVIRKSKDTVKADDTTEGTVSLNRKVMRHAYKTTGYRVQVYNGGNTRADRQKCQEIAAKIKASYPNMPIYVHFYSPSWKCRAGNFTNRGEADSFLRKIKAMGYKTAVLVKGTISVQY